MTKHVWFAVKLYFCVGENGCRMESNSVNTVQPEIKFDETGCESMVGFLCSFPEDLLFLHAGFSSFVSGLEMEAIKSCRLIHAALQW